MKSSYLITLRNGVKIKSEGRSRIEACKAVPNIKPAEIVSVERIGSNSRGSKK